jgi:hypothetical protein
MFNPMKKALISLSVALLLSLNDLAAQCAMCRSTLENNYSAGNPGIGAGINTGILYLLVMPYLAVMIIGYLWFKSSKHAQKELSNRSIAR